MKILLVNPPNSGRSIPEERYGITSLRQILRGEPLALETLAGNLDGHECAILDLKVEPEGMTEALRSFAPDLVGITAMTCEAPAALALAAEAKKAGSRTVVGGVHASLDPSHFNRPEVDFVAVGLGKASFRELADALARGEERPGIPGIAATGREGLRDFVPRRFCAADLVEEKPPRYDLVAANRAHYTVASMNLPIGFVAAAAGCPHRCAFCAIEPLTGGRYLPHRPETVARDVGLLPELKLIRLVDANSFGDPRAASALCDALAGLGRQYVADVRADTVVNHPDLLARWKAAGLRAVVVGFEEIVDARLASMNKASLVAENDEAIAILQELGISIVGDFILSPDYGEAEFEALTRYILEKKIGLPMLTVLTPLPGTPLFAQEKDRIVLRDLSYYTLTNAVTPTRLPEERFYEAYATLWMTCHENARI